MHPNASAGATSRDRAPDPLARLTILALRTIGRTSDSVRLGYEHGFDSGEMMDRIYQDRASGRFLVGALVDRIYLAQPGCRGLRGRKELLKAALRDELARLRAAGGPLRVIDVAAGPATYLAELLAEPEQVDVRATARDLDARGLMRGRGLARSLGVSSITYETGDALDDDGLRALEQPGIVIASGFYELLLDDDTILRSMAINRGLLGPDGALVFTTQVAHPQVHLMALIPNRFGQPWIIRNRPLADAERLAREAGFRSVTSRMEPTGIFAVSVCRP